MNYRKLRARILARRQAHGLFGTVRPILSVVIPCSAVDTPARRLALWHCVSVMSGEKMPWIDFTPDFGRLVISCGFNNMMRNYLCGFLRSALSPLEKEGVPFRTYGGHPPHQFVRPGEWLNYSMRDLGYLMTDLMGEECWGVEQTYLFFHQPETRLVYAAPTRQEAEGFIGHWARFAGIDLVESGGALTDGDYSFRLVRTQPTPGYLAVPAAR